MSFRSTRTWLEAALFLLAVGLGAAGSLGAAGGTVANTLYFGAWSAALLLVFSLGLRLPLHSRGPAARFATPLVVAVAFALLLLSNIALYRHDAHFDVTVTGTYTAPPELETVARSLDRDVVVSYFYNSQDGNARAAKDVLAVLARRLPHLRLRALDLDKELIAARNYGVRLYNTVVVEADGRRTEIENTTDLRQVAFAIERVLKERTPMICFVTGHGEAYESGHVHFNHVETLEGPGDVLEAPSSGLDRLKLALESIGYADRAIAPAALQRIPGDCAIVADVGPRTAYAPGEARMLGDYLDRGGRALLMYDPEFPVAPELEALLGQVGVMIENGVVIDPLNHSGTEQDKVAVPYYPPHPITSQIALTVFPGPRPIRLGGPVPGVSATDLASSSNDATVRPGSAGAATVASAEPAGAARTDARTARGPITLAVALQGNWPDGGDNPFRLVVVGSASIAANAFFPYASNGDLVVSMVRWLAGDMATPKLKPESYSMTEIRLTHREMQVTFVLIELLLPLSVMLFGMAVWWRRR